MKILGLVLKTGLLLAAASVIFPVASRADTFGDVFNFTYDGCTGGCSLPAGTISVSGQGTNVLVFDVDLNSTHVFHSSNAGTTFQFSISGATVTAANVSGLTAAFNWAFVTPTNALDAMGTWQYGFNCDGSGTPNNTCGHDLDFTLTFAAGTQAFVANETGGSHGDLAFGANLCSLATAESTSCATTGPVGAAGVPGPVVGAGLPGLIAACGGLIALARRRRQRNA